MILRGTWSEQRRALFQRTVHIYTTYHVAFLQIISEYVQTRTRCSSVLFFLFFRDKPRDYTQYCKSSFHGKNGGTKLLQCTLILFFCPCSHFSTSVCVCYIEFHWHKLHRRWHFHNLAATLKRDKVQNPIFKNFQPVLVRYGFWVIIFSAQSVGMLNFPSCDFGRNETNPSDDISAASQSSVLTTVFLSGAL